MPRAPHQWTTSLDACCSASVPRCNPTFSCCPLRLVRSGFGALFSLVLITAWTVTASGSLLFEIPAGLVTENGCAPVNFFYQPSVEAALRRELCSSPGVELLGGWQVESVAHVGEHCVEVLCCQAGDLGPTCTRRAAFVVGCDGASSVVRKCAGLALEGTSFEKDGVWLVVDVSLPREQQTKARASETTSVLRAFRFVCDASRPGLDLPLPEGHARFEWVLEDGEEVPSEERIREWIVARGVSPEVVRGMQFVRRARYVFHARACSRWCSPSRRLLVAGDAAHLTPPMRGQGLSSGVADANNLAWKLACVVRGVSPLELLDTYAQERMHRVVANTHIAVWLNRLIASRWRVFCAARDVIMPYVTLSALGKRVFGERDAMIASTSLVAHLRGPQCERTSLVGTVMPHHLSDGPLWNGPHLFLLLVRDAREMAAACLDQQPLWRDTLRARLLIAPWIPVRCAMLIRRDMYIMAAWDLQPPSAVGLMEELARCMEEPRLSGTVRARFYGALFAGLRVVSPQVIVWIIALCIALCFALFARRLMLTP